MSFTRPTCWLVILAASVLGVLRADSPKADFTGAKAGVEREVARVKLCWCPPGKFTMGSPVREPERRPGETQVEVTLSKGFWTAKYDRLPCRGSA